MLRSNEFRWYQLEDVYANTVALGVDYDLSWNDVEVFLQDKERYLHHLECRLRAKQTSAHLQRKAN